MSFERYTPKSYASLDEAEAAWESRFATVQSPCRSLKEGTLVIDKPIVIPPDPPGKTRKHGSLELGKIPKKAPHVKVKSLTTTCIHNWYRHGKDKFKRQRYKCSVCHMMGVDDLEFQEKVG